MTAAEDRARRNAQAAELHLAGTLVAEIAETLGVSPATARKAIKAGIEARTNEVDLPDEARTELARIDSMLAGLWDSAQGGNVEAIDRALRLQQRRAEVFERAIKAARAAKVPPRTGYGEMVAAFDRTAAAAPTLDQDVDAALIALTRRTMEHIDRVLATGTDLEVTKALYLKPHVMKGLREMLATPMARKEAGQVLKEGGSGRLRHLRSITNQSPSSPGRATGP